MDPQTMLIGAAIFVVSAIVIYLISVCSMREKTFEEVLEEQRKLQAEELKKQKVEKKDKVRRRYPGRGKGKKDKADDKALAAATGSLDTESDTDRLIEEAVEAQIVEPVQQQKPEKKRKDKKKSREDAAAAAVAVREEDLYEPLSKDQVEEVMVEAQKAAPVAMEAPVHEHVHKEKKSKRVEKEEKIEEQIIVQETVRVQEVAPLRSEPPQVETKKSKKKSPDSGAGDSTDFGVSVPNSQALIQMVRKAVLTETEITLLVETIQGKQGATPSQWTKKSKQTDSVNVLKKQLEEKERSFQEEHQLAQNAAQKLRDLRAELARERQRYETLDRQSADKLKNQQEEKDALRARMQQSHDQHMAEVGNMRRQVDVAKLSQDQTGLVQRLTEENQKLKEAASQAQAAARRESNDKQQLKILQEELSKNVVKLNASTGANKTLEAQLAHYKEQLKKIENTQHEVVARKMNELTEELRRSEGRNTGLGKDLEAARSNATRFEQELTNVHNRMKDFQAQESHARAVEQQLQESLHSKKSMESRMSELERVNKATDSQLKQLREENNLLAAQLKESKERTSGEGQEAPAAEVNGEVSAPAKTASIALDEHAKLLSDKEDEIKKLQSELQTKLQETSKLNTDLETQKQKNNALREKNWKAMDALSQAEKQAETAATLKASLSSKVAELEHLKNELQMAEKHKHELVTKQESVVVELKQQMSSKGDQEVVVKKLQDELSAKGGQLKELEQLRKQLKEFGEQQNVIKSLKVEMVQKDKQLMTLDELKKQMESYAAELKSLSGLKQEMGKKDEEIKKMNELRKQLEAKEKQLQKSLGEQEKVKDKEVSSLSEQLKQFKEQNQELVKTQKTSASQVTGDMEKLKSELANKATEASSLQQKVQTLEASLAKLEKQTDKSAEVSKMSQELDSKALALQKLAKELGDVRAENQELQEKNKGISDDLQKSKQAKATSSEQKDLAADLQHTKQVLQRVFPDVSVSETTKYSEWLSTFEKQVKEHFASTSQSTADSNELEEARQSQSKLQAQVNQYKDVLADTEGILNKLQSSVEEEENKWRQRVTAAEERSIQMEQQVKALQENLSTTEDDKSSLQSKLSESTQSLNSLKTEMVGISSEATNKGEEISNMKQEIEEALKQKKELTSATVRLNGMLKTGQDALKAEQDQVAKLRAQLSEKSKGLANGSSKPQEIEQLKVSLAQTQRQLEREVQVNKQLTQRLGAGADSSGDGTSV